MAKESELRESGPKQSRTGNARMKTGYGRESVGRPDETGIRRLSEGSVSKRTDTDTDQGQPSRQTSTASDMSGQV